MADGARRNLASRWDAWRVGYDVVACNRHIVTVPDLLAAGRARREICLKQPRHDRAGTLLP